MNRILFLLVGITVMLVAPQAAASKGSLEWVDDRAADGAATSMAKSVTNRLRAYPPSCLELPLPTTPSGPRLSGTFGFASLRDPSLRPVGVTIWRVPCSGSKGALLVTLSGTPSDYVVVPQFEGRQNGQTIVFRLAGEPNTRLEDEINVLIPSTGVVTFVLEVFVAPFIPDLNQAFTISAGYIGDVQPVLPATTVAPYDASAYPPVGDLPLTGYATGSYFDPSRSGEGMLLEVAEVGQTLLAVVSWYTFDNEGFPVWLVGAAPFQAGARSVTVSLASKFGGRIAGGFDPASLVDLPWGNITIAFPSCSSLRFSYQSTHNLQGLPTGSGQRNWSRLTSVNRFACE